MLSSDFVKGVAVGIGVAVIVPVAAVALLVGRKPLGRALSRGCELLSGKARETMAEAGEIIEDLIAESRAPFGAPVDTTERGAGSAPGESRPADAADDSHRAD